MTQEDKNLLLKDLCSRLPYGVMIGHGSNLSKLDTIFMCDSISVSSTSMDKKLSYNLDLDEVKPYLFPLPSMDEELKNFLKWKLTTPQHDSFDEDPIEDLLNNNMQVVNFCYEYNLDINGLIPKGLAEDATVKNIY